MFSISRLRRINVKCLYKSTRWFVWINSNVKIGCSSVSFKSMFLKRLSRIRNKEKCEETSDLLCVASFNHSESLQCVFFSRTNLAWCLSVFLQEKKKKKELFNWQIQRSLEVSLISANFFFRLGCGERRRCQSRRSARLRNLFSERADLFLWIIGGSAGITRWQLLGQERVFFPSEIAVQRASVHQQQIRCISLFS